MTKMNVPMLTRIAEWFEAGAPAKAMGGIKYDTWFPLFQKNSDSGRIETTCNISGLAFVLDRGLDASSLENIRSELLQKVENVEWVYHQGEPLVRKEAERILGLPSEAIVLLDRWGSLYYQPKKVIRGPRDCAMARSADVRPADVAVVIRHLIATGDVDWTVAFPDWEAMPAKERA